MSDDDASPPDRDPRRIVAVALPSLLPESSALEQTEAEQHRQDVARDWQMQGTHAQFLELSGVLRGNPPGRMTEIFARIASSGEQLMLAATCLLDARRWDQKPSDDLVRGVASRALAEMANYFALSAAHGLANVSLRLLLLDPESRADLNKRFRRAAGFEPFAAEEQAWRAVSRSLANELKAVAATRPEAARELIEQLVALTTDRRWQVLMDRRAVDFHRLRPQSVGGGVALGNPWQSLPNGQRSLSIGEFSGHEPPDAAILVRQAADAVDALTEVAEQWMDCFPNALEALLGTKVFKD